jgi:agmatine deiminase
MIGWTGMSRTLLASDHGFAMPPEWHPHAATWTAWPADDELWLGELEPVRRDFTAFIRTIAEHEPVELLVRDADAEADATARLSGANVRLHRVPYDDVWVRDSGPIFIARQGRLRLVNWEFNGWGQKYNAAIDNDVPHQVARILGTKAVSAGVVMEGGSIEVNGSGSVLTTKQCLLSPMRNPALSEAEIEALLAAYLGTPHVLWLDQGLEGDHTDGHIDTITRFIDQQTIVTVSCEDRDDANFETTMTNLQRLRSFTDTDGHPFRIVELPLPAARREFAGQRLPLTYANFYIVNGAVLVPIYDDPNDARALDTLRPLFPGRHVIGLKARHLITGGGAFHCVTQQQPTGILASES